MHKTIKPIETFYNGYRFRSRLEARWAVFSDTAKIKYQYEPEGYRLRNGQYYLPDFYLPDFDTHVEVKRDTEEGRKEIIDKCQNAIEWGGPIKRILVLSDVPEGRSIDGGIWHFPCLYWDDSSPRWGWWFFSDGLDEVIGHVSSAPYRSPARYFFDNENKLGCRIDSIKAISDCELKSGSVFYPTCVSRFSYVSDKEEDIELQERINEMTFNAFKTARQARFEHGETPKIKT